MRKVHISVREISVEEFDEMIENHDDLLIVDVRESDEFRSGHIPGALQIPRRFLEGIQDDASRPHLEQLLGARQKTLVLCGQSGSDSVTAAQALQQMGFQKVYSLTGGIERWRAQGFALVSE